MRGSRVAGTVSTPPTQAAIFSKVQVIEEHLHNREVWFGKSADQSGNNWGTVSGLTPYQAISGNGDFGSDADDEAKVLGSDDTPVFSGMTLVDCHRLMIDDTSRTTPYIMRLIHGTGTMAEAIAAGQYSIFIYKKESAAGRGGPVEFRMNRHAVGTKVWVQCKNATDNATVDFFLGHHEYVD